MSVMELSIVKFSISQMQLGARLLHPEYRSLPPEVKAISLTSLAVC